MSWVEWLGAATGVAGSLVIALNFKYSAWGFPLYAVSNVSWIAFGLYANHGGIVTMNVVFLGTTSVGLWRWFRNS